jgi:hypothetical protein
MKQVMKFIVEQAKKQAPVFNLAARPVAAKRFVRSSASNNFKIWSFQSCLTISLLPYGSRRHRKKPTGFPVG